VGTAEQAACLGARPSQHPWVRLLQGHFRVSRPLRTLSSTRPAELALLLTRDKQGRPRHPPLPPDPGTQQVPEMGAGPVPERRL